MEYNRGRFSENADLELSYPRIDRNLFYNTIIEQLLSVLCLPHVLLTTQFRIFTSVTEKIYSVLENKLLCCFICPEFHKSPPFQTLVISISVYATSVIDQRFLIHRSSTLKIGFSCERVTASGSRIYISQGRQCLNMEFNCYT